MTLAGTRPILQDELLKYELHHRARIAIKPGITGMWQVSGRSDITDFEEVVRLDTEYISKKEVPGNPLKAEYLIPIFIGELLEQGKMSVKVLKTNDTWYGMTYHEDVAAVKGSFKEMLENGVYKADLFSDL